jgi:hypothetical protein
MGDGRDISIGGGGSSTSIRRSAGAIFAEGGLGADETIRAINPDVSNRLIDPDATAGRNLIDSLPLYYVMV